MSGDTDNGQSTHPLEELMERSLDRRNFIKAGLIAGGTLSFPSVLAACGGGDDGGGGAGAPAGTTVTSSALNDIFGPGGEAAGAGMDFPDGMMLAITGQGSFFGKVMSRGAKLAAKQIKAAGGPNFEISIADHQSGLVPPAVNGVRRLITENDIVTLQTSYGAPSEAIIPLIQQNKVVTFNGGGSSPGQLFKDYLWMTRMLFAYDPADGALAWLAENHPDVKKLAVLGTRENGVEAMEEKAPRIWPKLSGGTIVAKEVHEVGATNFRSVIARVRASGAQAVFTVSFGNDLGYMVKQFREANVDIPIMGIEYTDQACEIAGDLYDTYLFATDYYDTGNPNPFNRLFVETHREDYGEDPEYYGSNYWEQAFIIWDLIRRVIESDGDPKSGEELEEALKGNPTFKSVYGGDASTVGEMSFDLTDHSISKPMGVFSVEGCKPKLLAPIKKLGKDDDPASALDV